MTRKKPETPLSQIKNVLRKYIWLRCRERQAAMKRAKYYCECCGRKQSKAKDRDPEKTVEGLQVHHKHGIDWTGLCRDIRDRLCQQPELLIVLCKECHDKEHKEQSHD